LPLAKCVVNVTAPELAGDRLVSVRELAAIGGIAPSTLRAYISRGEEQVPSPQAVIGGRSAWSWPVAEEWAEQRRRDNAAETVAINHRGADMHPR
jgi:predicted DNA-binding transcriptional regulator AlpA